MFVIVMLAARFVGAGKPFSVEHVDIPIIGPDDVLVEVKAAGICGSDVHYKKGDFSPDIVPITLGHEGAGVVKEIGENVSNLNVGDHVVIHYVVSCGNCKPCLQGFDNQCRTRRSIGADMDGTFAEYIKVPSRSALRMKDNVPFEWGAIAACAVSTAYHAVRRSNLMVGDTVAVFGTGGVGIHAVMWAKFFCAGKVIAVDLVDSKLETSELYGADITVNPSHEDVLKVITDETDGWGVDAAIECSGSSKALEQAIKAVKGKNKFESGTVVSVGLQTKPFQAEYWRLREGCLTVSGDHTRQELYEIIRLMETKRIDLTRSITHHVTIQKINEGIDLVESREEHVQRVVVDISK